MRREADREVVLNYRKCVPLNLVFISDLSNIPNPDSSWKILTF